MLDVSLFRNPRFTAASGSVTVSFFALSGFIFLMTQYFQFLKGYGPLSTGVHLLPVASAVGVASVLGTKLAVRVRDQARRHRRPRADGRLLRVGLDRDPRRPATARSRPRWSCSASAWG